MTRAGSESWLATAAVGLKLIEQLIDRPIDQARSIGLQLTGEGGLPQ
ncbi:hypothetical protein OG604_03690 [Streptomyces sp. NBC_01231]|nr:hypothetical protein OG604_03690 [Streptomyces sp. NBC_01231]